MFQKSILLIFFGVILLIGCQNRNQVRDQIDTEELTGFDQLEEVKDVYYRFPSPDEMLSFLDQEEIYFNDEFIHTTDKANSYLDSKAQALNLGIYIADLAYITLFQRQKEALIYLQVVYGLSDKLRISSAFDPSTAKKFEDNIDNLDSLKVLADQSLTEITNYLVREEKERVLSLISIGGFVESLFLAFEVVDEFSEDNMIIQRISDQKLVLENLINYTLEFEEDENVSYAITLIQPIRAVYDEMIAVTEETEISKSEDGKLIIGGGDKLVITEEQFVKLRGATNDVRKKIIENLEN